MLLPVTHTFGAHGTTIGSAHMLLGLGEPHQNLRSHCTDLHKTFKFTQTKTKTVTLQGKTIFVAHH